MIRERKNRSLLKSLLGKAVLSSLVFHLAAYGLLAAWSITHPAQQPQFQGDAAATQIVLHLELAQPNPPMVSVFSSSPPVLITPGKAHLSSQTFLDTSSADVALSELVDAAVLDVAKLKVALLDVTTQKGTSTPAKQLALDEQWIDQLLEQNPPPQPAETKPADPQPASQASQSTAQNVAPQKQLRSSSAAQAMPPDFSGNRPPRYPARDLQLRREGLVLLRLHVNQQGRVTQVQLIQSSGYATLDAAAANAVRSWQGKPALREGKPIATTWDLPVRFRLGN